MQAWEQLQGEVVEGKFPLSKYLGGSEHSGVFLSERPQGEPRQAAIKLVPAGLDKAEQQLSRWAEAAQVSHPYLIRLLEMGRCRLQDQELLYLVMEYAEEDLSQVVSARALSPRECQDMLPAVVEALGHIHRRGFVHSRIKPANVMAIQDSVKVSSDALCHPGDKPTNPTVYDAPESAAEGVSAAADVWSLGMLLVEVLTQKVPALEAGRREPPLPPLTPLPLVDVVRHSLRLDPKQRWTVAEIAARLAPTPPPSPQASVEVPAPSARAKRNYLAGAVALAVIVLLAVLAGLRLSHGSKPNFSDVQKAPAPQATSEQSVPPTASSPPAARPAQPAVTRPAVLHEVLPRVPQSALNTIHGTIRVRVKVAVDPSGNVAKAEFESPGPSKYFARLSMQAAQAWKFTPPEADSPNAGAEWSLRFEYRRDSTRAFPTLISR